MVAKSAPQPLSASKFVPPKLSSRDLRDSSTRGRRSPSPELDEDLDAEDEFKPDVTITSESSRFNATINNILSPEPVTLPPPRRLDPTPPGTGIRVSSTPATHINTNSVLNNMSQFGNSFINTIATTHFDQSTLQRSHTEVDVLRDRETEQLQLQGTIQQSRNLLIQKSQEEIAILQLSLNEQKETYEAKLLAQSQSHEERVKKLVKEYELKLSIHAEADKARIEGKEIKIKHKYEAKLKEYEKLVSSAMDSCKQRELTSSGVIQECRHELSQAKLAADAKERTLRDELRLKDNRLSDIQQKLQTFHDVQKYGRIWKNNAINISYAYLQLCATSTIKTEVEKDNFTQYLSGFDRIFENMKINEDDNIRNEVCVNKKAMKKLLKQAKKILERAKCEEEILQHNKETTVPTKIHVHSDQSSCSSSGSSNSIHYKEREFNNSDVHNVCDSTYGLLVTSDEDDLFYPY